MKRRLLSLLLVMAMLLSMVPFQAFAEEVDEAPALLEETEEIVSEPTEETIADPTEDTVPDTTEETVPDTTEETVPETTEETVPDTTEETVPETTEETVPVVLEEEPLLLEEPEQVEVPAEGAEDDLVYPVTMYADETLDLSIRWGGCTYNFASDKDYTQYASLEGSILTPKEGLEIPEDPGYVEVRVYADNGEEPVPILVKIYPAEAKLPLMILEGMEPGEDMPQKHLRVGDEFQLKAKLTEDSEINEGIEWFLDVNEKYEDCPPFFVATDGTVTFNTDFKFYEEDAEGGAWNMVVARQVVKEGEKKTVADTPAVIAMFPELNELRMYIGDEKFEDEGTINVVNGFKPVSITAFPDDYGPFGGVTLTLEDSNKVLKSAKKTTQHMDGPDCDSEVYTVTPKKYGTFTITATSKDNPEVTLTTTVTVVNETREIHIKLPSSARTITQSDGSGTVKAVILTAGQKLSLSTDIPKTAADKAVTWEIIDPYVKPKTVSDDMDPEGATASGQNWDAYASIDSKGVLRTKAGVTMETVQVGVRVRLTSTAENENPVEDYLLVYIQPPVETLELMAIPLSDIDDFNSSIQESMESGSNIRYPEAERYPINLGPMLLIPVGRYQNDVCPDVSWKFSGSKKVAEFMTADKYFGDSLPEEELTMLRAMNARVMIPKAPGKVSITATSKDGSGAKFSGALNLFGPSFAYASMSAPKNFDSSQPLHPGDRVQFTSEAYYYEGAPATDAQRYWYVYERVEKSRNQPTDFATIDQKGRLTITDRVSKPATLTIVCVLYNKEGAVEWAEYSVNVEPVNDYTLGMVVVNGSMLNTVDSYTYEPGKEMTLLPVWVNNSGSVVDHVAAEDVSYKVSGKACAFDQATGELTFKEPGTTKITVTATLDGKKQSATYTFRCEYFTRKTEILNKPESGVITVVGGKSLSLKAINWSDEAKTKKATDQSIFWRLDGPYADINHKTGKLTTEKVTAAVDIKVEARCRGIYAANKTPSDSITIRIIPEKTQYRSCAGANLYNGYFYLTGDDETLVLDEDFGYRVTSYGCDAESRVTDVISDNPKIAQVEKDKDGHVTGIKIPKDAKPDKVTITVKGQVLDGAEWVDDDYDDYGALIDGHWEGGEWIDAPKASFSINVVKPVTSIEIKWPTDKDDNELPLYVGKSLRLKATVNKDATNKKLVWHIDDRQPSEYDYFTIVNGLNYFDKTTIKNGVLKVDKSTLTASRYYYVWATSEDGFAHSNAIPIQAYAMTGAIEIASIGNWPNGNYADYLNNRTVTIQQGEEVQFGAMVSDVNGYYEGANQDVTWTISGNKGGIIASEEGKEYITDVLNVTGLKPGTVTIKAAAKDGSKKTATFKLVVKPHTLSAPNLETDELYRSCSMTAPSIAYNYTEGDKDITWLNPTDVEFTSDYSKVKIGKDSNDWRISVDANAKLGKVVTITVKDVRTDIEEIDRAQPLSLKFTIADPQP